MGQKIHPTAFRLAVGQTWQSLTHPIGAGAAAHNDNSRIQGFIFPLIHNTFLALNILTSFPILKITPQSISIQVKAYTGPMLGAKVAAGQRGSDSQRVSYLTVFIKSLLQKKYNTRVQLTIIGVDSYSTDPKIMGD